jgi:hypothetical protein
MLFANPSTKIKAGDFVIGARKSGKYRSFSEPTLVLEVNDSLALIVLNEFSQWVSVEDLELVRIANEQTSEN